MEEDDSNSGANEDEDDSSRGSVEIMSRNRMNAARIRTVANNNLQLNNASRYRCGICNRILSKQSKLTEHLKRHANKKNQLVCARCGLCFLIQLHKNEHKCVKRNIYGNKKRRA